MHKYVVDLELKVKYWSFLPHVVSYLIKSKVRLIAANSWLSGGILTVVLPPPLAH
jgi:hypothetical protein